MNRREALKAALVSLFTGRAVVEITARHPTAGLLLEDARTNDFGPSQEFDSSPWQPVPWPPAPITEEMFDDATVALSHEHRESYRRVLFGTGRA